MRTDSLQDDQHLTSQETVCPDSFVTTEDRHTAIMGVRQGCCGMKGLGQMDNSFKTEIQEVEESVFNTVSFSSLTRCEILKLLESVKFRVLQRPVWEVK